MPVEILMVGILKIQHCEFVYFYICPRKNNTFSTVFFFLLSLCTFASYFYYIVCLDKCYQNEYKYLCLEETDGYNFVCKHLQ